jgi:exosome complex component CSL4
MNREKKAIPGDKIAVSEEFLPGENVYEFNGTIRASASGIVKIDMKSKEIRVIPAVKPNTVEVGDYIIGQVESVQQNLCVVRIYHVNDKFVQNSFSGILSFRNDSPTPRYGNHLKLGDIVRCKVISKTNNMIHLSIDDDDLGVLFALCSRCGKRLMKEGNRAKCVECGNIEQRKFAKSTFSLKI